MKAITVGGALALLLLLPYAAFAFSGVELDPSAYPREVREVLDKVRSECKEEGNTPTEYPAAGVTVVDLDQDGSKDIILDAWRACEAQIKNFGACNTAGCELKIFKQIGPGRYKSVLDEVVDPEYFLSASETGRVRLIALSVSRKITDRCPDPDGGSCDFLLRWKHGRWVWDRIR
jgi:hypothetical protein